MLQENSWNVGSIDIPIQTNAYTTMAENLLAGNFKIYSLNAELKTIQQHHETHKPMRYVKDFIKHWQTYYEQQYHKIHHKT